MGAPCRWGPGLGSSLCPPPGAKSREDAPERCLEFSGEGWPFDTDDTPAVGLLPFPLALGSGRQKRGGGGGGLRLLPAEAAACRWPAPGARKPAPPPLLQSSASAPPTQPSGKRAGGSLFSITALEPHP